MPSLHRAYRQARVVEEAIAARLECLSDDDNTVVYSYPWHNGRENGFSFTTLSEFNEHGSYRYVFVAEARNSDRLTVTTSDKCFGEWAGVSDEDYRKREFFDPGQYEQVADRVLDILGVGRGK